MRRVIRLTTLSLAMTATHGLHVGTLTARPAAAAVSLPMLRGGKLAMSTATATAPVAAEPKEKFRKDYTPPPYRIDALQLDFDIHDEETLVTSRLTVVPSAGSEAQPPFELDGEDLVLRSIELDGSPLSEGADYTLSADGLSLHKPPNGNVPFVLKTVVSIAPQKNTQLSGLYKSSGMYVTQCEAEGFRRITYFQDRPDIMAKYTVRVEADKAKYPLLLSNGNEVGKGEAPNGRHWASFVDPFRKPSYLFALVAGDLGGIESTYTTSSGREVRRYEDSSWLPDGH